MNSKIYVGNIAMDTTEDDLRDLFGKSGEVVSVNHDARANYAFVEMATPEETMKAIQNTNGRMLNGRELKVNEMRVKSTVPRTAPPSRSGPRSRARSRSRR